VSTMVGKLRRYWWTLRRWWPAVWRPVLVIVVGIAGTLLFSKVPAPPESAEFVELADTLRAAGVPEEVIDETECGDESIDYRLDCAVLAIDASSPARVRIAVGTVSNVAGYWSGSDAHLELPDGRIPATSRTASWGNELTISLGKSTVWVDVQIPALGTDPETRVLGGEAFVEVRYPKRTTTQQGSVTVSGFTNTSTRLTRDVEFLPASETEIDRLATLSQTPRDAYPWWQLTIQYTFGIGFLVGIVWLVAALWKGRHRPLHRRRSVR